MSLFAIAGTTKQWYVVVDFTDPINPTIATPLLPIPGQGNVVASDGALVAIVMSSGSSISSIVVVDVSDFVFSTPVTVVYIAVPGSASLSGDPVVALNSSRVAIGGSGSGNVALFAYTNSASGVSLSYSPTTISSISAIGMSDDGTIVVVASANAGQPDPAFVVLKYPAALGSQPTAVPFWSGTDNVALMGKVTCDVDGTQAGVADSAGGTIYLFNISGGTPSLVSQYASTQQGFSSIAISGSQVAAASVDGATMTLVDFSTTPPSGAYIATGLSGSFFVSSLSGSVVAAPTDGSSTMLFTVVNGTGATPASTAGNAMSGAFTSVALTSFIKLTSSDFRAALWSPAIIAFGNVPVGTTSAPQVVTLTNDGTALLTVSNIQCSAEEYQVTSGNLALGSGVSTTLSVSFAPTAAQVYQATLTMSTDDPNNPTISIPLSGSGLSPVVTAPSAVSNLAVATSTTSKIVDIVALGPPNPTTLTTEIEQIIDTSSLWYISYSESGWTDWAPLNVYFAGRESDITQYGTPPFGVPKYEQHTVASPPAAVSRGHNTLDVFATDQHGNLWHLSREANMTWGYWTNLGQPTNSAGKAMAISSPPAVAIRIDIVPLSNVWSIFVYVTGSDGNVYHMLLTGAPTGVTQHPWQALGLLGMSIDTSTVPVTSSDGRCRVIGSDGNLYQGAVGVPWSNLGRPASGFGPGSVPGFIDIGVPTGSGQNETLAFAFARDANNNLCCGAGETGTTTTAWTTVSENELLSSTPAVSSSNVCGIGADGNLYATTMLNFSAGNLQFAPFSILGSSAATLTGVPSAATFKSQLVVAAFDAGGNVHCNVDGAWTALPVIP